MEFLSEFYYTNLFNGILILLLLFYSAINYNKLGKLKLFFWYFLASFFQIVFATSSSILYNKSISFELNKYSVDIFIIIEFLIISLFLFISIENKRMKKFILFFIFSFLILVINSWNFQKNEFEFSSMLFVIEYFGLLIIVMYFLYENIEYKIGKFNFNNPSFWIGTGILLLFSLITPINLFIHFFPSIDLYNFYIINNISYILYYLILSYSMICKVKLTI